MDLCGQRFGRLLALEQVPATKRGAIWRCRCDCGNEKTVASYKLRTKNTSSCGCYHRDSVIARSTTHGHAARRKTAPEYNIWCWMKQRCCDPKCHAYRSYGGRGIFVCDRWLYDFSAFFADMGP